MKYVPASTVRTVESNEYSRNMHTEACNRYSGTHEKEGTYISKSPHSTRGTVHTLRHPLNNIIDFDRSSSQHPPTMDSRQRQSRIQKDLSQKASQNLSYRYMKGK